DQARAGRLPAAYLGLEGAEEVAQARADLGAHDGSRAAREFADARAHLARQRDEHVRCDLVDSLTTAPVVPGVAERPQQGHRYRADPVVYKLVDCRPRLRLVQ